MSRFTLSSRSIRGVPGRSLLSGVSVLALVLATAGLSSLSVAVPAGATPSASNATSYSVGTPVVSSITNGTSAAPWNEYQGDAGYPSYTSQSPGTVLPKFTPGGANGAAGTSSSEPNLAVYAGASSGTDGNSPYPAGVVGSPGSLTGYCGSGNVTQTAAGSPVRQPPDTTLPLAPAYFPHIVRNSDGSLTGYFDYRPKDADEAIVAGISTDNGKDWTYQGEALEQSPTYCPVGDSNDDGEGHPNVIQLGGVSRLYTLPRAAGDNIGTGMLVHTLTPTSSNPLAGLPATEKTGIDADDFVSTPVSIPYCAGATPSPSTNTSITADPTACASSSVTVPLTEPIGTGLEALNAGEFVDLSATPTPGAANVIYCSGVTSQSLTGCITNDASGIAVGSDDLIEQVIGLANTDLSGSAEADSPVTDSLECHTSGSAVPISSTSGTTFMPCEVPAGPNTTNGDGGLAGFGLLAPPSASGGTFTPSAAFTAADDLTMATLNFNAPQRLYIDGQAVYCAQSNAYPSTEIENCTTGAGGSPVTVHVGDPVLSDPVVPQTAQQTTGLVAPDGIVGVLPSYPGAPQDATVVMYTEKVLNYFDLGYTGSASTFGAISSLNFTDFPNTAAPTLSAVGGHYTVSVGDFTAQTTVQVTCTGYTTTATTGSLTGCSNNAPSGSDVISKNTYIEAPGSANVPLSTLQEIGEGKSGSKSGEKNFGNNEDETVLRVAYTTDGVNFSTTGLANGGIISGQNNCATSGTCSSTSSYDDINNPSEQTSPSNLNGYADNDAANGSAGSSGGTDTGGTSDADEMRWVGSAGSIVVNPDGSYGLFLSGGWTADGDSDSFNQIFYSTSTDGEYWSVPTPVVSTDYSFAASVTQDNQISVGQDSPLGISAYYSGRAYAPSVVQNPNGTLTMLFAGDRVPKSLVTAGASLGTNPSALYTPSAQDPALYRNILAVTLTSATSPLVTTQTAVASSPADPVAGQTVTYTATVSVPAPGAGTPTGTVSFSGLGGTLCSGAALSLSAPDSATCTTVYSGGTQSDTVTATYSGDVNYDQSSASTTVSIGAPLSISGMTNPSGYGAAGDTLDFEYLVTDTGPDSVNAVAVTDSLGLSITCPDSSLASGASETCSGEYTVTQGDVDAGSVSDTATASATDDTTSVDSDATTVVVEASGATSTLSLAASSSPTHNAYAAPGHVLSYSYLVTNSGTTTESGIGVTDSKVTSISCPQASLAPGVSETCTGSYTVTQADVNAGSVSSTATAHSDNPQGVAVSSSPSSVTVDGSPEFTSADTTTVEENETLSFTITADGDAPTFSAGPGLPSGVTLASDGVLSGTPRSGVGEFVFTITATDAHGDTSSQNFMLYVEEGPPGVTTTSLPNAEPGVHYVATLEASGGTAPYKWSLVAGEGKLPGGLSLSKQGVISGKPTARAKTSTFTVKVTDKTKATGTATLTITVS